MLRLRLPMKVGMLSFLTRLRLFIDRCPDEVVAR
jgi:hypothetical protein